MILLFAAGGNWSFELRTKAVPDDCTLTFVTSSIVISPSHCSKLDYDPRYDFAPITQGANMHNVMTVHHSVPAKALKELIDLAWCYPGKVSFCSNGVGTAHHLAGEILKHKFKLDTTHVPYNVLAPAVAATTTGEVDIAGAAGDNLVAAVTSDPPARAGDTRLSASFRVASGADCQGTL